MKSEKCCERSPTLSITLHDHVYLRFVMCYVYINLLPFETPKVRQTGPTWPCTQQIAQTSTLPRGFSLAPEPRTQKLELVKGHISWGMRWRAVDRDEFGLRTTGDERLAAWRHNVSLDVNVFALP